MEMKEHLDMASYLGLGNPWVLIDGEGTLQRVKGKRTLFLSLG